VENLHLALVDLPINVIRMLSWRGQEAIQQSLPVQAARRPKARAKIKQHHKPSRVS
jgi:hypothetical protein